MTGLRDLTDTMLTAWRTNDHFTVFLIRYTPDSIWTGAGARSLTKNDGDDLWASAV
jgi:hypothetical protein